MSGGAGAQDAPHRVSDKDDARVQDPLGGLGKLERRELVAWVGENLPEVRRTASGQRPVLLDPRDRPRGRLGGSCRRVRAPSGLNGG